MNSDELRSLFFRFFEEKGHKVIPSSSLIPVGDPTLLLTNAGMVQIKPYFLGEAVPPSRRLASCQKCFRTSDIESVGDATHLTFFEMLGNFSVGDYFKKEAIAWGWEFVTERLKLPVDKLWITIFLDDDESYDIWREIGIPAARIMRFGEEENFWGPAGSSGPCGPCSEIHYDLGADIGCGKPNCQPNCACGRFTEIWNLVFPQYNQDEKGNRNPLPRPNIDTGMGLERTTAVINGKKSVYDTDLFAPLLDNVSKLTGKEYGVNTEDDNAMRVLADHSRALAFLIADGVQPGKVRRGHVLRRLLRRAQYFSEILSSNSPLLVDLAEVTINNMKHIYPELEKNQEHIINVIESEVYNFQRTLPVGKGILNDILLGMREEFFDYFPKFEVSFNKALLSSDFIDLKNDVEKAVDHFQRDCRAWEHVLHIGGKDVLEKVTKPISTKLYSIKKEIYNYSAYSINRPNPLIILKKKLRNKFNQLKKLVNVHNKTITGIELFTLYDTYGFPVELTKEIVSKSGFSVDMDGFAKEMAKQRERARASHKFDTLISYAPKVTITKGAKGTEFTGYTCLEQKARVVRLLVDGKEVGSIVAGQSAGVVLDATPFYAEMGGQVGDTGEIIGSMGKFSVTNTVRFQRDIIVHQGRLASGTLKVGESIDALVDVERRRDIARNHTATHLLQAALRQVLGGQIQQRGSMVAPDRLRFDFSHLSAMTPEEIKAVQRIVNEKVRQNIKVYDEETDYKKAIASGAIALFDEKYGDTVRVLRIGEPAVSTELCGGTHVSYTGEIGYFHILSEGSIGAGLRRIEAVTGRAAEAFVEQHLFGLEGIAKSLETSPEKVKEKVDRLLVDLEKETKRTLSLERVLAKKEAEALSSQKDIVKGINVISARVSSSNQAVLGEMADFLRDELGSGIVVLGAVIEDIPIFIASASSDIVNMGYNASEIVRQVSKVAGGGGGGKANFAQGSGKDKSKLDDALRLVKDLI